MDYNVEHIRTLVGRWLAGETTLAEEATLRQFFAAGHDGTDNGVCDGLPADLQPLRPLFGQSAAAAGQRSRRQLVLHLHTDPAATPSVVPTATPPREGNRLTRNISSTAKAVVIPLRRRDGSRRQTWWSAAAGIAAAAVLAAAVVLIAPERDQPGAVMCVIDGVRITDPAEIAACTLRAIATVNDNLERPGRTVTSRLDAGTAGHVEQMLKELTKTR